MIIIQGKSPQDIMDQICNYGLSEEFPSSQSQADRIYLQDVFIDCAGGPLDLNLSNFSFGQKRWDRFCENYLDSDFLAWMNQEKVKGTGLYAEKLYLFDKVRANSSGHRRLGNCLVSMSYHRKPSLKFSLVSRTSNWIPTGSLDLSLASLVSGGTFTYYLPQLQFSIQWGYYYLRTSHLQRFNPRLSKHAQYWLNRRNRRSEYDLNDINYKREAMIYKKLREPALPDFTPDYLLIDGKQVKV